VPNPSRKLTRSTPFAVQLGSIQAAALAALNMKKPTLDAQLSLL
jgi:hypothetical protein